MHTCTCTGKLGLNIEKLAKQSMKEAREEEIQLRRAAGQHRELYISSKKCLELAVNRDGRYPVRDTGAMKSRSPACAVCGMGPLCKKVVALNIRQRSCAFCDKERRAKGVKKAAEADHPLERCWRNTPRRTPSRLLESQATVDMWKELLDDGYAALTSISDADVAVFEKLKEESGIPEELLVMMLCMNHAMKNLVG